jgi:hypothetical protein
MALAVRRCGSAHTREIRAEMNPFAGRTYAVASSPPTDNTPGGEAQCRSPRAKSSSGSQAAKNSRLKKRASFCESCAMTLNSSGCWTSRDRPAPQFEFQARYCGAFLRGDVRKRMADSRFERSQPLLRSTCKRRSKTSSPGTYTMHTQAAQYRPRAASGVVAACGAQSRSRGRGPRPSLSAFARDLTPE